MIGYLKGKAFSKHKFHVEVKNNTFIFHIDANFLGKKQLVIAHRKSGKRILKNILINKAKFNSHEIVKLLDISGTDENEDIIPNENNVEYFDIYVKIQFLDDVVRQRSRSTLRNKRIKIFNPENKSIVTAYTTINGNLSLDMIRSKFEHSIKNINSFNNCLNIEGKIKLFEDLDFDELEISTQNMKTNERKYFKCQYTENNGFIDFISLIDFKIDEDYLNSNWKTSIRLKNNGLILAENYIDGTILTKQTANEDNFCLFKKESIKIKKSLKSENENLENPNENYVDVVCLAVVDGSYLKLEILSKENWNKKHQKEEKTE